MLLVLRQILLPKQHQRALEVRLRDLKQPPLRQVPELTIAHVPREAIAHPPTPGMQIQLELQLEFVALEVRILARMPHPKTIAGGSSSAISPCQMTTAAYHTRALDQRARKLVPAPVGGERLSQAGGSESEGASRLTTSMRF